MAVGGIVETRSSEATPHKALNRLEIFALGEIRVVRDGKAVPLPASKRTRALLGYLVASGARHTRQALCDLLWEGPDDPRGALRWSLTKLRPVVNERGIERLATDREHISFSARGATTDIGRLGDLLGRDPSSAGLTEIEEAAALLSSEFLDGLELPSCYRFHHWCLAERERWGALRRTVLTLALRRLADDPERSLPYARAMVASDPLSEGAHGRLTALLASLGRRKDAQAHYDYARQMLLRETGAPLIGELRRPLAPSTDPRAEAEDKHQHITIPSDAANSVPLMAGSGLVGRNRERQMILDSIEALLAGVKSRGFLFSGEPGIGKSRLLQFVSAAAKERGALVLAAKCFEAEAVRPYGCWLEVLGRDFAALLPRRDIVSSWSTFNLIGGKAGDRTDFFMKVKESVDALGNHGPIVLIFDDLQWVDEGSSSLLHYMIRAEDTKRLLFVGSAREDEIDDNPWCKRLVSGLTRAKVIERVLLAPLDRADAAKLLGENISVDELSLAMRMTGGNPLYIVELAAARASDASARGRDLDALIADRISRLDAPERELLTFASAMSRDFKPELLGEAMGLVDAELFDRIQRLERKGFLKPRGDGRFDFAHDLIRQSSYRELSQPSRRLIHRQIARVLKEASRSDSALAGDWAYHAGAAGDHSNAVEACILAGEHCLRLYANAAAIDAADRGRGHLEQLPTGADRARRHIALLNIIVFATATLGVRPKRNLLDELRRAAEAAELLGLHDEASLGWHLVSWWTWRSNDSLSAQQATIRAELASRPTDHATRCQQLANTGRCLLEVEAEVERARAFAGEAGKLAVEFDLSFVELEFCRGLLARWDGDLSGAQEWMRRAVALARLREDRWHEAECLVWLGKIALECNQMDQIDAVCDEIDAVAHRMGEDRAAVADAFRAIATMRRGRQDERLVRAGVANLRTLDDKAQLAYVLNEIATCLIALGRVDEAREAAAEALTAARIVRRTTEIVVAASNLARAGADSEYLEMKAGELADISFLSARARSAWDLAGGKLLDSNAGSNGAIST
jgi:DNA-binding SARP family transcriptional activator